MAKEDMWRSDTRTHPAIYAVSLGAWNGKVIVGRGGPARNDMVIIDAGEEVKTDATGFERDAYDVGCRTHDKANIAAGCGTPND